MKEIELTQGYVAVVDDEDFERLAQFTWRASVRKGLVYARRTSQRDAEGRQKTIYMHHDIAGKPEGFQVDHRDGNPLNNVRSNLRIATRSENQMNRGAMRNNKLGIKGVSFVKSRGTYQCQITFYGKDIFLGHFKTAEEARDAYQAAALEYHGKFAKF